jgi:hypothetical protein
MAAKTSFDTFIKQTTKTILFKEEIEALVPKLESVILFGGRRCGKTTSLNIIFNNLLSQIADKQMLCLVMDFRVLFGNTATYNELCECYIKRLEDTLEYYGIERSLVKKLHNENPILDIFIELPTLIASTCKFYPYIFCVHDEIEYTYHR